MSVSQKCGFCDKEAVKLCDHVVLENGTARLDRVCNIPLCEGHAVKQGTSFDLHGPGIIDSIDYCPLHDKIGWKYRHLQRHKK